MYFFNKIDYRLGRDILFALLLFSIALPTVFTVAKLSFIVIIFAILLLLSLNGEALHINRWLLIICIFYSSYGLAYSLFGLINGNPGAVKTMTVMVVYPVLFTILSCFIRNEIDVLKLSKTLIIACWLVVLIQLMFLLSVLGLMPGEIYGFFNQSNSSNNSFYMEKGVFLFTMSNTSSLLFLIPFLFIYILLSKKIDIYKVVLLVIMFSLILVTGRRAFFVSFFFSVLIILALLIFIKWPGKSSIYNRVILFSFFVSFSAIVFIFLQDVNFDFYVEKLTSILDFSTNESNIERVYQFQSLLKGIELSPLFGYGAGAAADYVRSQEQPWAYELSYVSLAYQYGLIGLLLYSLGVSTIIFMLVRICSGRNASIPQKKAILSFFGGFISFMIANATNPYFAKFDYMWVLFVPIFIVNVYMKKFTQESDLYD